MACARRILVVLVGTFSLFATACSPSAPPPSSSYDTEEAIQESSPYVSEARALLRQIPTLLADLSYFADAALSDASTTEDPNWKTTARVVFDRVRSTGQGLQELGPAPDELGSLGSLLTSIGEDLRYTAAELAAGTLDGYDPRRIQRAFERGSAIADSVRQAIVELDRYEAQRRPQ